MRQKVLIVILFAVTLGAGLHVSGAVAVAAPATAPDALTTLRSALRALDASDSVSARVERRVDTQQSDKPREQGSADISVTAGPGGMQLSYPPDIAARVQTERRNLDLDQPHPTVRALDTFPATDLVVTFNSGADLLRDLDGATVISDAPGSFGGAPARLLELNVPVHLSAVDQKRVSDSSTHLKLWLGDDGLPRAMDRQTRIKGRIMLIGFEISESVTRTMTRKGDRLIALREDKRTHRAGFGASFDEQRLTTVTLK